MIKKIKIKVQSISECVFTKYYIAERKIGDFLIPAFDPVQKERGLVISGTALAVTAGIVAVLGLGTTIWGYQAVKKDLGVTGQSFLAALAIGLGYGLVALAGSIFNITAKFLSFVLTDPNFIDRAITTNKTFTEVWGSVRDLSNMLLVLGFVVVGLATALRLKDYEAKKLLVPLILFALLINFSGLFCGLIIDASNITMNSFLQKGNASGSFTALTSAVNDYVTSQLTTVRSERVKSDTTTP